MKKINKQKINGRSPLTQTGIRAVDAGNQCSTRW